MDLQTPPKDAPTKPRGARTGYVNRECYAQELADCCQKITREHFVSENMLKRMASATGFIDGYGIPLERGQFPPFRPADGSLSPKVLCERHNGALSLLDETMGKFFRCFSGFAAEFRSERPAKPRRAVFNGHDVERWCLKLLCAAVRGGVFRRDGLDPAAWLPPGAWLEVLFGERRLAPPLGIHFVSQPEAIIGTRDQVALLPLFVGGAPLGLGIGLSGFLFVFAASSEILEGFPFPNGRTYRLHDLRICHEGTEKVVAMRWRPGEATPTNVPVTWYPPPQEAPENSG